MNNLLLPGIETPAWTFEEVGGSRNNPTNHGDAVVSQLVCPEESCEGWIWNLSHCTCVFKWGYQPMAFFGRSWNLWWIRNKQLEAGLENNPISYTGPAPCFLIYHDGRELTKTVYQHKQELTWWFFWNGFIYPTIVRWNKSFLPFLTYFCHIFGHKRERKLRSTSGWLACTNHLGKLRPHSKGE